jgi:hypothetical protein
MFSGLYPVHGQFTDTIYPLKKPAHMLVTPDRKHLLIACEASQNIEVRMLQKGYPLEHTLWLENAPSGLICNGDLLYITLSSDTVPEGKLVTYRCSTWERASEMSLGHGAHHPILTPDKSTLIVLNEWTSDVSLIDLAQQQETARIKVLRQPSAACLSLDGQRLYVSNLLPETPANRTFTASAVSVIDLTASPPKVDRHLRLVNGSNAIRGMVLSPDGQTVLVSHTVGRFMLPTTQLEQGWMYTAGLSLIDTATDTMVGSIVLDDHTDGAANPWELCFSEDGQTLYVAHAGVHEVSVIDYPALKDKLTALTDPGLLHNSFGFLQDLRRRLPVPGQGPRALTCVDNQLIVACYFSDSLATLYDSTYPTEGDIPVFTRLDLNPNYAPSLAQLGEMAYHDASYCFQRWQSCSSCHPDARNDAQNWDLLNDGMGNPKNVKSHLYSAYTPPSMITGIRADYGVAVRAGFKFIQFAKVPLEKIEAIEAYLRSLEPVPSPYLINGKLSEAAQRGKMLFNTTAGCTACHSGTYMTNMIIVPIGQIFPRNTLGPYDTGPYDGYWDVPSLREVWRTGPYLHDGRHATIEDLLFNGAMYDLHFLTEEQILDLAEYVKSL